MAAERGKVVAAANSLLTAKANSVISWGFLLLLMVPGRTDKATRIHKKMLYLTQCLSMEGYILPPLCLPRNIWQCLVTILVVTTRGGIRGGIGEHFGIKWVAVRNAAKHSILHKTAPVNKELFRPNWQYPDKLTLTEEWELYQLRSIQEAPSLQAQYKPFNLQLESISVRVHPSPTS